jgi:hypothetical protein
MVDSLSTRHWSIRREFTPGLVWLVRSGESFVSVEDIHASFEPVYRVFAAVPRERSGLIIDMRGARWRNDGNFEEATAAHRKRIVEGFARVAMLVRTSGGKLQAQRLSRVESLGWLVLDDERRAREHALGR